MSAEIYRMTGAKVDPSLTLEMVKANIPDIQSVVISVITEHGQATYWSDMAASDMTYHMYGIQADLLEDLQERGV